MSNKKFNPFPYIELIHRQFQLLGNKKRSQNQTAYLKNILKFHGLSTGDSRKYFLQFHNEKLIELSLINKLQLGFELLKSDYGEEKVSGIQLISLYCKIKYISINDEKNTIHPLFILKNIQKLFELDFLHDWATVDLLSSHINKKLILIYPDECIKFIEQWKYLNQIPWIQRSSCVSCLILTKNSKIKYIDNIYSIIDHCILNKYRFVQLGVGWLLRELTINYRERTIDYIEKNYHHLIREGLRYALEKLDKDERNRLMKFQKTDDNQDVLDKKKRKLNELKENDDVDDDDDSKVNRKKKRVVKK
ncbi:unnamed protein product [Didymodactylos carnosus]|uniref:DNA alkylation repair protein n=1 Tax=Didymodactylos carnosus TaxID=1234261 RepID=A0A815CZC5_9BILA|nr:unnamed protein product [Didymodactylos carnosus]CAF1291654.1 unnamed protein product [Didymodactylos carnosus]CAF3853744.1 unnamed protein product [Didymodactylos carnosus]CAF4098447.1 unnamed protein product [Didymodactylos carnosus]